MLVANMYLDVKLKGNFVIVFLFLRPCKNNFEKR